MFDRKLLYTLLSIGAVVMIAVTLGSLPGGEAPPESGEAVSRAQSEVQLEPPSGSEAAAQAYEIREYNGQIAVFLAGGDEPQMVLETQVKFLPDLDRAQLAEGIRVQGYEELTRLIEDYIS